MQSSINTFPATFTETFANGRPHRPGHHHRGCDWSYNCRRPMPFCDQVCYPRVNSCSPQMCRPFNSCGHRSPYGGTSYDGCTRIHCNDNGCRVVDSYSFGGSCRCNPHMGFNACPVCLGGGMTNQIQIDVNK